MKKFLVIGGMLALAATLNVSTASAQGRGGHGGAPSFAAAPGSNQGGSLRGLDRADQAAGIHGDRGRDIAETRGSHKKGFCPPGQAKKSGYGSRFHC